MSSSTVEAIVKALETALSNPSVKFLVGKKARDQHGAPGRVVWVPTHGEIKAAERIGPVSHPTQPNTRLTPLYAMHLKVEAHIWEKDLASAEALWQSLLAVCWGTLRGASKPGIFVWDTETDRSGLVHGDFAKLTQQFEWSLMVSSTGSKRTDPLVQVNQQVVITTVDLSFAIDNGL